MARLNANPNAEASVDFAVIKPGIYRMRVEEITEFISAKSGNTCWKVRLAYVDPSALSKEDGSPAGNVGNVFDNSLVIAPADKQGKTRGFVEALGAQWSDLDSEDLIGLECDCRVGIEEYQGNKKNVIARYLKK